MVARVAEPWLREVRCGTPGACQNGIAKGSNMTTQPPTTTGSKAPDATLIAASGDPVQLRDQWEAAPKALALVFLRHFG